MLPMPYVKHPLGQTYYEARGKGKKTPIVFLHGGPGGSMEYGRALFRLAKGRRVFLYDQLGCGRSGVTKKSRWTVDTFTRELDLLVKAWGLKEFHLVGTSWGGTLAMEVYLRRKGKGIRSLTFQSPLLSSADWKKDCAALIGKLSPKNRRIIRACHAIGATDAKVYGEAGKEFMRRFCMRNAKVAKALEKKRKKLKWKNSGHEIYNFMWGPSEFHASGTLKSYDRVSSLRKITVPTLFLGGEHDEAMPRTLGRYAKLVKGARHTTLRGVSHAILYENPAPMLRALGAFLAETER